MSYARVSQPVSASPMRFSSLLTSIRGSNDLLFILTSISIHNSFTTLAPSFLLIVPLFPHNCFHVLVSHARGSERNHSRWNLNMVTRRAESYARGQISIRAIDQVIHQCVKSRH